MPHARVMATLLQKELLASARTRGIWAAASVHIAALTIFLFVWGDGVPAVSGTVLDQFAAIQHALLAVLLPWVACRCLGATRDDLVRLAAATAARPRHVLATKWVAASMATLAVAAVGLPHAILAHRIAGDTGVGLAVYLASVVSMCILVASVVVAWMLTAAGRLGQWIGAGAMVVAVLAIAPDQNATIATLAVAAGLATLALSAADRRLRYLS